MSKVGVIGLGYVGFPVALTLAMRGGHHVVGIDRDGERLNQYKAGALPIAKDEPGLKEMFDTITGSGDSNLHFSHSYEDLRGADVVLINVDTPLEHRFQVEHHNLRQVCRELAPMLHSGSLVIVESTVAPGTTRNVVYELLRELSGLCAIYVAACPERVSPGTILRDIVRRPRIIGGVCTESAKRAKAFYGTFVQGPRIITTAETAELVKLGENAYRDVLISFANELALISETCGADVWTVRELINGLADRPDVMRPGIGVGGHCLPKDSKLLTMGTAKRSAPSILDAARTVNKHMPYHVGKKAIAALEHVGKIPARSKIAVFGVAYKPNVDDMRASPAWDMVTSLHKMTEQVVVFDPHVPKYATACLRALKEADCLILAVAHNEFYTMDYAQILKLMNPQPILIDCCNMFSMVEGFQYYSLGKGELS